MVSVSEENVSGIDTHFRKYRIGGIDTFGIVSPITTKHERLRLRSLHVMKRRRLRGESEEESNIVLEGPLNRL